MTKKELIEKFSLLDDFESNAAAQRALAYLIDIVTEELQRGYEVDVSGFGKFTTAIRKGKTGKVPGTNRTYTTQDKVVPKFRPSTKLKRKIAGN